MVRNAPLLLVIVLGGIAFASCSGKAKDAATTTPVKTPSLVGPVLVPNPMLPPKVYTDGVGTIVELVPLKTPDGQRARALLRITGTESVVAGVTFMVTRSDRGNRDSLDAWTTEFNGETTNILRATTGTLANDSPTLYVPRGYGAIEMRLDPEAGKRIDVNELIADHKSHLADGSLAKYIVFDRAYAAQVQRTRLDEVHQEFVAACGKEIEVDVAWESFPDQSAFGSAGFCQYALKSLTHLCEYVLEDKKQIAEKIDRIHCQLADDMDYSYVSNTRTLHVRAPLRTYAKGMDATILASRALNLQRTVVKSDKGLYLVIPTLHQEESQIYAGTGPKLYRQHTFGKIRRVGIRFWSGASVVRLRVASPGQWQAMCPAATVEFAEVTAEERDRVLKTSTFEDPIWKREARILARDNRGTYYYVDQLLREFGGLGYRVFKGPRGRLTLTTMVDIVDDSQGTIFATTSGSLRLTVTNGEMPSARWLVRKKSEDLVIVSDSSMKRLVYGDLGIYAGQELGTICTLSQAVGARL